MQGKFIFLILSLFFLSLHSFGLEHFYKFIPGKGYLLTFKLRWYCPKDTKLVFLFLSRTGKVYRKSYKCRRNLKKITVRKLFKDKFHGKVLIFKPETLEIFDLGKMGTAKGECQRSSK